MQLLRPAHALLGTVLLASSFFGGCRPEERSGTVTAYAYVYAPDLDDYAVRPTQIRNLESLRELRGRDFEFRSGAWLETTLGGDFVAHDGRSFALEYDLDENGTVVPADLHSLYALSAYRALDDAAVAVRGVGFVPGVRLNGYYFPESTNPVQGDDRGGLTDNAAFISQANGLLFVPSFALAEPPLLVNHWVMAHEYGHFVIHQQLFGDSADSPDLGEGGNRHLSALHEGAADLIAVGVTGETNGMRFIREVDVDRDVNEPRTIEDVDLVESASSADYDPHLPGSLLARAIYETWPTKTQTGQLEETQREQFLQTALATLAGLDVQSDFNIADFANLWVQSYAAPERTAACETLVRRLGRYASRLTACEGAAQ